MAGSLTNRWAKGLQSSTSPLGSRAYVRLDTKRPEVEYGLRKESKKLAKYGLSSDVALDH